MLNIIFTNSIFEYIYKNPNQLDNLYNYLNNDNCCKLHSEFYESNLKNIIYKNLYFFENFIGEEIPFNNINDHKQILRQSIINAIDKFLSLPISPMDLQKGILIKIKLEMDNMEDESEDEFEDESEDEFEDELS